MKLEKLGRKNKNKIAIGVVVFLCFISAIMFVGSRAKYKVTQSIPLVNGTINYKPYDFKMMAMYQANESGGYTEIDSMPTNGYEINEEKSYCTTDNVNKDTTAKLYTDEKGQHVISNLKKNSKCYIWFDKELCKGVACKTILANSKLTAGATSFTGIADTDEGLKSGEDDDGTTYYFRGNVTNNWVQFAGFYWRIIRINGDESIRMIYNGISTTTTGDTTQIGTKAFNSIYNDNAYVGYMYGTAGSSAYAATHANINPSTILGTTSDTTTLLGWYKTNIVDKGYSNKISTDAGFCNDRKVDKTAHSSYQGDGYGANATGYAPWGRLYTNRVWKTSQTPSFKCTNASSDLFTTTDSTKGNKKLAYPVGLITADEVVFAGGFGGTNNSSYYLYTNKYYWTMSPYNYGGSAYVFYVISAGGFGDRDVRYTYGVRPVINLASNVILTGSGTTSDPYKVV